MSFLTLEDVNTVNLDYINEIYEIDTSLISTEEFSDVKYDFCKISHSIDGDKHIFTFKIYNSDWNGRFYSKNGGNIVHHSYDGDKTLIVTCSNSSIILQLYLCSYDNQFQAEFFTHIPEEKVIYLKKNEIGVPRSLKFFKNDSTIVYKSFNLNLGINILEIRDWDAGRVLCLLKKTDLVFNLDNTILTNGIVNHVPLNVDSNYLPSGSLVDKDLLDIQIKYENNIIQVFYDDAIGDYCFDLDLTKKKDNKPVKLEIVVNEIDVVKENTISVTLPCNYPSASNMDELISHIVKGIEIVELADDIDLNRDLIIYNDLLIYANNHDISMDSHNIRISKGTNVEIDDANVINGVNCFIQENNSKLILNNSKFSNARISDNYKGSVISSEYETSYNNIKTELNDCTFINCHHTLYISGNLKINNCKALFNNYNGELVDNDYPAFLTFYNGKVEITNSIFDIDYNSDHLCDNQKDIKFAQALIGLSGDTLFNEHDIKKLKYDNALPFFEAPFYNKSHIFVKYHYPLLNECVVVSPIESKEDNAVCHCIMGVDWIYKNNVKITRKSWNSENNIRKIKWEG